MNWFLATAETTSRVPQGKRIDRRVARGSRARNRALAQLSGRSGSFESFLSFRRLDVEPTSIPSENLTASEAGADPVVSLLDEVTPAHPALKRLAERRNATQPVEASITSYDRMHHRHSRS